MLNLTELNGLLAINKLVGLTSAAVIRYLKLALTQKATPDLEGFIAAENTYIGHAKRKLWVPRLKLKVGHGGTLDPFASGVLVVGLGDGCKMLSRCLKGDKGYTATGCLGYATDTLDIDGIITDTQPSSASKVTESQLLDALSKFVGEISQMPPLYVLHVIA
ncbi:TruB pseudouridine (psi) synthase 1 [Spiromyces aspiralis]|uniref:TruB pseudouridine (Psi) synthase 1 n=1 Tax=Spiromyces aspiralis TaxID=68401 RepID=A0ACC1HPM7_9FUNG|nr:TruB pseudouridine (psi) synthase 1 [Spiromyces aspiralis]